MNVNGARFDLLLGRDDWGSCLDGDTPAAAPLGPRWDAAVAKDPPPLPAAIPDWDVNREELALQALPIDLPRTPADALLSLDARRAAAADRNGNIYRIGDDRQSLRVYSVGSRDDTPFWSPAADATYAPPDADFAPIGAGAPTLVTYLALAVTADDYLVVAFRSLAGHGFLAFDLLAGGPPVTTAWPLAVFQPFAMASRDGGGVWLLERDAANPSAVQARIWELDCKLAVVDTLPMNPLTPAEVDDFQPTAGPPRVRAAATFPGGVALGTFGVQDAIALASPGAGTVLVLERDAQRNGRVVQLTRNGTAWQSAAGHWLNELPDPVHDATFATATELGNATPPRRLLVSTASGQQAFAYALADPSVPFDVAAAVELFPLRRYGGRALLVVQGAAWYDSGLATLAWAPVVQQPRFLFRSVASLVTPYFDSQELGTTWDRVVVDARLPAGTSLTLESRAGDNLLGTAPGTQQVLGTWMAEPSLLLRRRGPELPWLRGEAASTTQVSAGIGSWEALLQRAQGRYLQLRLTLASGNGASTPRVRALRAWSPRFSYPQRFLPAVYREDPVQGLFLERWLANLESTLTCIEDRLATAQWLLDARTIPAEGLAWLAAWFELALDANWDERRQRLFVLHAMDFFQWRGTVYGLRLALQLAFDPCFDEAMFDGPDALPDVPQDIRIVEAYQTRIAGALVTGDPTAPAGPVQVQLSAAWSPQEGNAGLVQRYAAYRAVVAAPQDLVTPFSLLPPADATQAPIWAAFCQSALGFVPAVGAAERLRWQNYLSARYPGVDPLAVTVGQSYASFADVPLPRDWPAATLAQFQQDWTAFSTGTDGAALRGRWQDFLARRYRTVARLNQAWNAHWPQFNVVALPDVLPDTVAAQNDWLQFEGQLLPIYATAHRFSVLLPVSSVADTPYDMNTRLGLAQRIVELEKPAHTVYDLRFYWAMFRVGAARLGLDSLLGQGSRAPELIPATLLGQAYLGASFVGGPARPPGGDRLLLGC